MSQSYVLNAETVMKADPPRFFASLFYINPLRYFYDFYTGSLGGQYLAYGLIFVFTISYALINDLALHRSEAAVITECIVIVPMLLVILPFIFYPQMARVMRRTERSIERVIEDEVAVNISNLNERTEVRSSDEIHLLAESFNRMSDRLREQIAREAETRQFQTFMRLSAMLTHDLKNSIASLSLLAGNMERQFHNEEFRADAILSLKDATDRLRSIVARLNEPAHSLSRGSELWQPHQTDLVPIIKRVLDVTIGPVESLHEVEIRLPLSLVATIDADRIENVVENLIINALEAMDAKKGKLTIEAGKKSSGEIFFSVTDTGSGISQEFLRTRLFRPFATTKAKGVGLGLYASREVVRVHGGHIKVETEEGKGSTFRVVLPSSPIIWHMS